MASLLSRLGLCEADTNDRQLCKNKAKAGSRYCHVHIRQGRQLGKHSSIRSTKELELERAVDANPLADGYNNEDDDQEYTVVYNALATADWQPDPDYAELYAIHGDKSARFVNLKTKERCCCCACEPCDTYRSPQADLQQLRNYKNRHCMDCVCRWCVCDAHRVRGHYDSERVLTPFWDNPCWSGCATCSVFRSDDGLSSVPIHNWPLLYNAQQLRQAEEKLRTERRQLVTQWLLLNNLLVPNCVRLVAHFVDVEPEDVVQYMHQLPVPETTTTEAVITKAKTTNTNKIAAAVVAGTAHRKPTTTRHKK